LTRRGAPRSTQDRKSGRVRQQRWRARQRVREQLRDVLGYEPSADIMAAAIEGELEQAGLTVRGKAEIDEPPLGAETTANALDHLTHDGVGADDEPIGTVLSFRQHANKTLPPDHPARRSIGQLERSLSLSAVGFELRIAADREKIYSLLMTSAERGDVASLLWLASRLAPAAKQRRAVHLPELAKLDLKSPNGIADAVDTVLGKAAAGELDLADAQLLLDGLRRRQEAAEATARTAAYQQAAEALKERGTGAGGLAARLAGIRARLAGDQADVLDATAEPAEAS
jgi:hypothetical protein